MKLRAKRLDNGEEVIGSYHHIIGNAKIIEKGTVLPMVIEKDKVHSIELSKHWILIPSLPKDVGWQITDSYLSVEIDPTTLAMSTGVPDKNGTIIFGSVPVDAVMSNGGDIVHSSSTLPDDFGDFNVIFEDAAFYIQHVESNSVHCYLNETEVEALNLLITGKQFDNQ